VDFSSEILDERPGFLLFRCTGSGSEGLFRQEAGGMRWQRIPPTEKRGRVHTSTVTVAVLEEPEPSALYIDPKDLDETFTRGSGAGGQHRNVTASAVVLVHKPTGIRVRINGGRSQHINRQTALAVLRARLLERQTGAEQQQQNRQRKQQVGSGMRGDKIRTIQVRRGKVTDHRTGKTMPLHRYLKGYLEELH